MQMPLEMMALSSCNTGECILCRFGERNIKKVSDSAFIDKIVNFLGIGLALYIFGQTYGAIARDNVIKRTVKCKYCRKHINEKASITSRPVALIQHPNVVSGQAL